MTRTVTRTWTTPLASLVFFLLVSMQLASPASVRAASAEDPCAPVEISVPFRVGEWTDLGAGAEGWWLERLIVRGDERSAHGLEGRQEPQTGFEVEIDTEFYAEQALLGELELEWRDEQGSRIGSSRTVVGLHPHKQAGDTNLRAWLFGSEYGWQRAHELVVRVRLDAEVPELYGADALPQAPHYEHTTAPLDPGPFGVDTWRSFECGFGLPPICESCVANGQQCYEVDVEISSVGVKSKAFCSTPTEVASDAWDVCNAFAVARGFFCRRPSYRRAQIRHRCDFPHLRYPYTSAD